MKKPALGAGLHLALDGYGGNQEQLANLDLIYEFLEHCPDLIHMTKIMPPYVFKYHAKVPEDWGVSGFVLVAKVFTEKGRTKSRGSGHISIHTFPKRGYLSLDIFSSEDFDHEQIMARVTELFGIERYEFNLSRGEKPTLPPEDLPTPPKDPATSIEKTRGNILADAIGKKKIA